jgi:hypothetical protein
LLHYAVQNSIFAAIVEMLMFVEDIRKLYAAGYLTACEVRFNAQANKWYLQFFNKHENEWVMLSAQKSNKTRLFPRDRLTTPIEIARVIGFREIPVKIDYLPEKTQIRANPVGNIHRFSSDKEEKKIMRLL